uniref:Putative secreted protein n=1 Tax=Amblyomma triste TaxID=251400 RepID=A0A023G3P8_AMBTT
MLFSLLAFVLVKNTSFGLYTCSLTARFALLTSYFKNKTICTSHMLQLKMIASEPAASFHSAVNTFAFFKHIYIRQHNYIENCSISTDA